MKTITTILVILFSLTVAINSVDAAVIGDEDNDGSIIVTSTNTNTNVFTIVPSDGEEKLTVKFALESNVSNVKLINSQSIVVFEGAKTRGGANNVLDIPIEEMEAGTYFIRVQTDEGISVQRVIIQK